MDTSKRRLKAYVHVPTGDGGFAVFGPSDTPPAWAAELIGEHCWTDGTEEDTGTGENIVTTSRETGLLAPSSTPLAGPGHRSQTVPRSPAADAGIAEAERRFGRQDTGHHPGARG